MSLFSLFLVSSKLSGLQCIAKPLGHLKYLTQNGVAYLAKRWLLHRIINTTFCYTLNITTVAVRCTVLFPDFARLEAITVCCYCDLLIALVLKSSSDVRVSSDFRVFFVSLADNLSRRAPRS